MGAAETTKANRENQLPPEAKKTRHSFASTWSDVVDPNALLVIRLKGAVTNEVYQIKWQTATGETSGKVLVRTYGDEISELEIKLSNNQHVGFCHNDIQYGNIMIEEETWSITIIDYEYASYNPVAFDTVNHFL